MTRGLFVAVGLLLTFLYSSQASFAQLADSAWPCAHQNLQRTGTSPNSPLDSPELLWSFKAADEVFGSPIVGLGDTVLFSTPMYLYALSMDGQLDWSLELLTNTNAGPVQGHDGTIYLAGSNEEIYFIDSDGSTRWRQNVSANASFDPTIGPDGTIYFGTNDYLLAMEPDHRLKWHFSGEIEQYTDFEAAPAIAPDGTIYCPCKRVAWQTSLVCLSPEGEELCEPFYTGNVQQITPSIAEDGIIYLPVGSYLYALNPDLTFKWRFIISGLVTSTPTIGKHGDIFITSSDGEVCCINKDGEPEKSWFFPINGSVEASVVCDANGNAYVAGSDGDLHALTPDGDALWHYPVGTGISSQLAIGQNGELLAGLVDGTLLCIGSKDSGNTAPELDLGTVWPATGILSEEFTYTVDYSDPDGDAPRRVSVWIDHDSVDMTLSSGTPSDGTYEYSTTLSMGEHTFYFSAVDARGGWVRYPEETAHFTGPVVEDEVPLAPALYLVLEKDTYRMGDVLNLYAYAENQATEPVFVDVYIALVWYDGVTLMFPPGFGTTPVPLASRVLLQGNERTPMVTVFSQTLPDLLEANYAWIGVLTPFDSPDRIFWYTKKFWRFTK